MTETTRRTSRTALVLSSLSLFALLGAGCGSKAATDAGETLDLAVAPDLKKPCGLGQHQCSPAEACIDESLCCTSAECAVSGSDCLPDHTCKCPAGRKACDRLCIPEANCCTKADCPVPGQTCQIDGSCQCPWNGTVQTCGAHAHHYDVVRAVDR